MIEIDENHRSLIVSLARCSKPNMLLELGYGSGLTTKGLLYAIQRNQRGTLIVVDNFHDWEGVQPEHFVIDGFQFTNQDEGVFLASTKDHFDFIVCDADHNHTHEYSDHLNRILNRGGYLIFHDVLNPMFPKLRSIMDSFPGGLLFEDSSVPSEECWRGLYVWQKARSSQEN